MAEQPAATGPRQLRSQQLARWAYERVGAVAKDGQLDQYWIAIADLGATIQREGLCAAVAVLLRRPAGDHGAQAALAHLAEGLAPAEQSAPEPRQLLAYVEELDRERYMLKTREALWAASWLKRAAQAKRVERELAQRVPGEPD
jgi:CRISPR/Cas system CMR-associated protein Cmr5 small subunit